MLENKDTIELSNSNKSIKTKISDNQSKNSLKIFRHDKKNYLKKLKDYETKGKLSSFKGNSEVFNDSEYKTSWNFTPMPFLFLKPNKIRYLNLINKLNFDELKNLKKSQSLPELFPKIKNDIYSENNIESFKESSPKYSFGMSRNVCSSHYDSSNIKSDVFSPSPDTYNIKSKIGEGNKYSLCGKYNTLKLKKIGIDQIGPGQYLKIGEYSGISKYIKNFCACFGKNTEKRDMNYLTKSTQGEPAKLNLNEKYSMFNGNGTYLLSNFRSNNTLKFGQSPYFKKNKCNNNNFPGPGTYNFYSSFQ